MPKKKSVVKVPPAKRPFKKIAATRKEGPPKIIPKPAPRGSEGDDTVD